MERKSYRWCAVPQCGNTSISTPNKLFINVPRKKDLRKKWLGLAKRKYDSISVNSPVYFCEDHFDIQKDMENYIQFKMGFSRKIRMADGVLPSKFHFQKNYKKRQHETDRKKLYNISPEELETEETGRNQSEPVETRVEIKIEKFDDRETLSAPEMLESIEDNDDKVTLEAVKLERPWQQSDKGALTNSVATASKYVQTTHQVQLHFSSKAVQKKLTRVVSVPCIDIPAKTSYDYIQGRTKSIIYKMYKYLLQEYRHMKKTYQGKLDLTPFSKVLKRVAEATEMSQLDLKRILKEEKNRMINRRKKNCVQECIECEGDARPVNNDHGDNSRQPETEQNKQENNVENVQEHSANTTDSQDSANDAKVVIKHEDYIQYNENEIHKSPTTVVRAYPWPIITILPMISNDNELM